MAKTKELITLEEQLAKLEKESLAAENGQLAKGSVFTELINGLKAMNVQLNDQYQLTAQGDYPQMSPEQHTQLRATHKELIDQSVEASKAVANNPAERERQETLRNIDAMLAHSFNVLASMDPKAPGTLDAAAQAMETRTVEILDHELAQAGANLSTRIPMTIVDADGKQRQGYFTAATTETEGSELQDAVDTATFKNEDHKKYFNRILFDYSQEFEELISDVAFVKDRESTKNNPAQYNTSFEKMLLHAKVPQEEVAVLTSNGDFTDEALKCARKMCSVNDKYMLFQNSGITDTVNMNKRNIGMSRVAGLLGVPNLIAQSMPMNVVNQGKTISGTFMENAQGIDLQKASPQSPLFKYGSEGMQKSTALKDLADLQVLDYICGNTDRHLSNFFYKMESGAQGSKMTGFMGIDNDCSFGEIKTARGLMVSPDNMLAISEGVATSLWKINGDTLRTVLADLNFTEAELSAAEARLETMQKACETTRVYKDNEWDDIKTTTLLDKKNFSNLLGHVTQAFEKENIKTLIKTAEERQAQGKETENKRPTQNAAEELNHFEQLAIFRNNETLDALTAKLEKADPKTLRSSNQFKQMKQSLETLRKTNAEMPTLLTDDYIKSLGACYKDLQEKSNAYLAYKTGEVKGRAVPRVELAKELSAFSGEYATAFDKLQRENAQKSVKNAHETQNRVTTMFEELKEDKKDYLVYTSKFQNEEKLATFGKQAYEAYEHIATAAATAKNFTAQEADMVRQSTAKMLLFEKLINEQRNLPNGSYGPTATALLSGGEKAFDNVAATLVKSSAFIEATPFVTPNFAKGLVKDNGISQFHKQFDEKVVQMNNPKKDVPQQQKENAPKEQKKMENAKKPVPHSI